jgi:hypothetical protein
MTKNYTKGAYIAPVLENLCFHCEQGFAQSAGIYGLTPIEGEWDGEVAY